MTLDIVLGLVFLGSASAFWYEISKKIASVRIVPDDVVFAELHRSPSRVKLFLLHSKTLYRQRYHFVIFWNAVGKLVYRFHIVLLRIDNRAVATLQSIRGRYVTAGGSNGKGWREIVETAALAEAPPPIEIAIARHRAKKAATPAPVRRVRPPGTYYSA